MDSIQNGAQSQGLNGVPVPVFPLRRAGRAVLARVFDGGIEGPFRSLNFLLNRISSKEKKIVLPYPK